MSATIELRNITKRFGAVTAVDDVSLKVESGELLTLLGPSGCGKTTILRLLSGFEAPTTGSILVGGADVTLAPPNKRDINQVFQSYALFPHLTVWDNIAFGLKMRGDPSAAVQSKVEAAIALVSLGKMEHRYPHQLSGGQRQRVALARAIVPEPRVLLLDEPLSALDAKLRREMQVELRELQRKLGLTTILVTHDQEEALAMSDRIAVMNSGRIEQLGTGESVYNAPRTEFVAQFLGEANLFKGEVTGVSGNLAILRLPGEAPVELTLKAAHLKVGEERTFSIRPESLQVTLQPAPENSMAATVVENTFLGSGSRILLEADSGRRLTALTRGAEPGNLTRAKDRVFCSFKPEDAVVLVSDQWVQP